MRFFLFIFLFIHWFDLLAQSDKSFVIAFGSCNKQDLEQPLWEPIINESPDLWIWLGDNIYGDTHDMSIMKAKYKKQNENEGYNRLKSKTKIIGIWDDHDYGLNDAGKDYSKKHESQKLALEFYGEDSNSERWERQGIYDSYDFMRGDLKIKVILLDTRFNRDTITRKNRVYLPNESGDVLGEEQWNWLESELESSDATFNIIGSSIQVIAKDHAYEKWANFPSSRKRLFDVIKESKAQGVVFLSGDRHIAEVSKYEVNGINYPLYDITSSGLTHTWRNGGEEENQYRIGELIMKLNYGVLELSNTDGVNKAEVEIKGKEGVTLESHKIKF
ncbi:MAG: alkaline phosphatase D family protein [Bacteroidota bacterium]